MFKTIESYLSSLIKKIKGIFIYVKRNYVTSPILSTLVTVFVLGITIFAVIVLPAYVSTVIATGLFLTAFIEFLGAIAIVCTMVEILDNVYNKGGINIGYPVITLVMIFNFSIFAAVMGSLWTVYGVYYLACLGLNYMAEQGNTEEQLA